MIDEKEHRTVLIDFGVSKQYDPETGDGTTTTPVGISMDTPLGAVQYRRRKQFLTTIGYLCSWSYSAENGFRANATQCYRHITTWTATITLYHISLD